jgi:alpha-2-macroglobulin
MPRVFSLIAGLALLCLVGSATAQPSEPQVSAFSPDGTVKAVRQAQAQFSVPMVPLGDPRPSNPFEVSCAESGTGRWLDTRLWAYG